MSEEAEVVEPITIKIRDQEHPKIPSRNILLASRSSLCLHRSHKTLDANDLAENVGGAVAEILRTGEETVFKIKKTTKLERVFTAYAERKGISKTAMRFLLDGDVIKGDQTPKMLELDDGDQIDCMLEQVGGAD